MELAEFLGEMQKVITASQQGDLFGDTSVVKNNATDACIAFLRGQGYSVGDPIEYPSKVHKPDDLITIFYSHVRGIYPRHLWPASDSKKDRVLAKRFIDSRMKADGLSREAAMQQCGYIIQTIFKHRDDFKFKSPPNFGILGQGEMAWVTDKAVKIMNGVIAASLSAAEKKYLDDIDKKIEENYTNLGHSDEELEAILKKLEAQYGKKES